MSQRDEFEKWASEPPREWDLYKYPSDYQAHNWPGKYAEYNVYCAWEAWQEATKRLSR